MPLRYTPIGAALQRHLGLAPVTHANPRLRLRLRLGPQAISATTITITNPFTLHRPFHDDKRNDNGSPDAPPQDQDHYATLNVRPDASAAEIKRSFYALSKTHHPDHNPADPHAPRRFMRISEAYSVLGQADKRARYDRDVLRRHPHHRPVPHHNSHRGSYHSSNNPAGGRPASGLSRRRGTFQGPPPSFFRSGGWGAHSAKRRAAHEDSTGAGHPSSSSTSSSAPGFDGAEPNATGGGMGPGQNPYRARSDRDDDVPHFDRAAHERTQRRHDERRARRMAELKGLRPFDEAGAVVGFLVITGILAAAVLGPYLLFGMWAADPGKARKERKPVKG